MLNKLKNSANFEAIDSLIKEIDPKELNESFSPEPVMVEPSSIDFEQWAMTTIKDMPGRPPVDMYLHGIEGDPPSTSVCWREEVEINADSYEEFAKTIVEKYPIKPHEKLSNKSKENHEKIKSITKNKQQNDKRFGL